MNAQRAAEIQAVLEGISLPAGRADLLAYAREHDASVADDLLGLPDEKFRSLDDVGRALTPAPTVSEAPVEPHPESDLPPGGDDYVSVHPGDTGAVRNDAPPDNPPQKAIEHASKLQKEQAAEQG